MTDKIKISKEDFDANYEVEKEKKEKEVIEEYATIDEQIEEADKKMTEEFFD